MPQTQKAFDTDHPNLRIAFVTEAKSAFTQTRSTGRCVFKYQAHDVHHVNKANAVYNTVKEVQKLSQKNRF